MKWGKLPTGSSGRLKHLRGESLEVQPLLTMRLRGEMGQTPHWVFWEVKAVKGRILRSVAVADNEAQRPEPQTANHPES